MIRELPDELRDNWGRAYQFLCVKDPSSTHAALMQKFREAGITDRLIVHLIETAIKRKRRNHLAWVAEVLADCAANGITTPDEWETFETEREAEDQRLAAQRAAARSQPLKQHGKSQGKSNVLLRRERKDEAYYDHIYKKFADEPTREG